MSRDIALEAIDLAGKTTLANKLADLLKARRVSEPFTETLHSAQIKEMIINNHAPKVYEIMGLIAQRVEAYQKVKGPYLSRGRDVVSDRCVVSSMVYQSSSEADQKAVLHMNETILQSYGYSVYPDFLIFIDLDYDTYMDRCANMDRPLDNKEKWLQNPANFKAQRDKYLEAIQIIKDKGKTLVFTVAPGVTAEEVLELVSPVTETVAVA